MLASTILLSWFLNEAWEIPFFTTFLAIGIIFVMDVVERNIGEEGIKRVQTFAGWAFKIALGLVIFLALRLLMGKAIGLYPVDTYEVTRGSAGITGVLVGRDISKVILWEIMFAFVAGGLVTQGKRKLVGMIFVISFMVLTLQVAFPKYTATWANRDEISSTLKKNGVLGALWKGTWVSLFGESVPEPPKVTPAPTQQKKPIVEFPISGEGHATKEVGLKAWLDPEKTYTRPSRPARYVFVEDTDVFFDDKEGPVNTNHKDWKNMPSGKYLVYPLKGDRVYFRWWQ